MLDDISLQCSMKVTKCLQNPLHPVEALKIRDALAQFNTHQHMDKNGKNDKNGKKQEQRKT